MSLLNFEWTSGKKNEPDQMPLLRLEHVSVRIGQRLVLVDISLEVFESEQVRLTGTNGSGKSTLFNAIAGVLPLSEGKIFFKSEDISSLSSHERTACGIRYMRQRDNVFSGLTVKENLQVAVGKDGYDRFREIFPEWTNDIMPNQRAGMLSGGQKQKLAWGMAVLSGGDLLLADEPLAGMSVAKNSMLPSYPTVIFIEHN